MSRDEIADGINGIEPENPDWPEFTLGLREGGLMEDPDWHIENIKTVRAPDLRAAKQKWAIKTGHAHRKDWDEKQQTYWGWSVVEVGPQTCRHCGKSR